jgi:hypothetical protein
VRVTSALFEIKTNENRKKSIMSNASPSTNTGAVAPLVPNVPSQQGAPSSGSSNLTAQQQQQLQLQYQQQQLQQQQSGGSQQGQAVQPGQVQPPQQHFPHQGLNGGWQSDKDVQERRKMIAKM